MNVSKVACGRHKSDQVLVRNNGSTPATIWMYCTPAAGGRILYASANVGDLVQYPNNFEIVLGPQEQFFLYPGNLDGTPWNDRTTAEPSSFVQTPIPVDPTTGSEPTEPGYQVTFKRPDDGLTGGNASQVTVDIHVSTGGDPGDDDE